MAQTYTPKGVHVESKKKQIENIARMLKEYPNILIVKLDHVSSNFLKEFKKKYRDMKIVVVKNTMLRRALGNMGLKVPEEVFSGQTALVLSNTSIANIMSAVLKEVRYTHIKAGHKTPVKVVIPAGSTGLPVSQVGPLFAELGILTSVKKGLVDVVKDATIANEGDDVSPKAAILLLMLGIKPIEMKLVPVLGICRGTVVTKEALEIPLRLNDMLIEAIKSADALAESLGIITETNAPKIIGRAYREAMSLAMAAGIVGKDTAEEILKLAVRQARALMDRANIKE